MKITALLFFIQLNFFFNTVAQEQSLYYTIKIAGQEVGSLLVTKKKVDSLKMYLSAVSEVEYRIFKKYHVVYLYEAIYENNVLKNAYFINKKNGEQEEEAKLSLKNNKYHSEKNGIKNLANANLLNKSMILMYWQPPNRRDSIFSERFHQYLKVAKIPDENRYIFEIPEGDKNIYSYNKEGICTKIEVDAPLISLTMELVEHKK